MWSSQTIHTCPPCSLNLKFSDFSLLCMLLRTTDLSYMRFSEIHVFLLGKWWWRKGCSSSLQQAVGYGGQVVLEIIITKSLARDHWIAQSLVLSKCIPQVNLSTVLNCPSHLYDTFQVGKIWSNWLKITWEPLPFSMPLSESHSLRCLEVSI